jgi:NADPH-dependent glutamate synthase beta subunit-like oxidoreductase
VALPGTTPVRVPDAEYFRALVPCADRCPVHTDAGGYVRAIAMGDDARAYRIAAAPNPLVSVCARICAHPCETACRRGRIDEPVSIRALKRFATERHGVESALGPLRSSGLFGLISAPAPSGTAARGRVAVVGAGPAGLSCARDLSQWGYAVTLFDAARELGGMVRLGVPEYRMPRDIIALEIQRILSHGVELRTGMRLGQDFSVGELMKGGYAAVFLSIGATHGRALQIPGVELDGVLNGVEFLLNVNLGYRVHVGQRVAVIGGGNVAVDVARTTLRTEPSPESETGTLGKMLTDAARAALRLGAREIHMFSLESRLEMPAHQDEIREAEEEGIVLHPSRGPNRIVGAQGRVTALETVECTAVFDAERRFRPQFREGSEEQFPVDTVILAIGQQTDPVALAKDPEIEKTPRGTIKIDPATLATSRPGVYAGGDAAFGPRIVIEAIADGRRAARSIDAFLRREPRPQPKFSFEPGDAFLPPREGMRSPRIPVPVQPLARRTGFREVEVGYDEALARQEADRCLRCHVETIFDSAKCILCGGCVDVCPEYCLKILPLAEVEGVPPELVASIYGDAPPADAGALVKDEDRCIRCALCAERCPTGAITMELFRWEDEADESGRS